MWKKLLHKDLDCEACLLIASIHELSFSTQLEICQMNL